MTRRTGRTSQPFQQYSPLPWMQSAPVKVTQDFIPELAGDVVSPILFQAN